MYRNRGGVGRGNSALVGLEPASWAASRPREGVKNQSGSTRVKPGLQLKTWGATGPNRKDHEPGGGCQGAASGLGECAERAGEKRHHVASRCGIRTMTISPQNRIFLYNRFRRKCARTFCQLLLHLSTLNPVLANIFGLKVARVSSWCV